MVLPSLCNKIAEPLSKPWPNLRRRWPIFIAVTFPGFINWLIIDLGLNLLILSLVDAHNIIYHL